MSPGPDSRWPEIRGRGADSSRRRRTRVVLANRRNGPQVTRTIMELEEQTSVGEVLVRQLMKAQLRSSLLLAGVVVVGLCGLPALFWAVPGLRDAAIGGVRLPWLLMGVLPYPFLVLVGYLNARIAERHERDFVRMVEE